MKRTFYVRPRKSIKVTKTEAGCPSVSRPTTASVAPHRLPGTRRLGPEIVFVGLFDPDF